MSVARARWAAIAAQLLLSVACGGGASPPPEPRTGGEIDLTRGSGAENVGFGLTAPALEPLDEGVAPAESAPSEPVAALRLDPAKVPVATSSNPSRGPADAAVVIQLWSDFECPFCARAVPTIAELERRFAGRLRIVWRNYPLPSHPHARLAARAALEAFAQRGSEAFWAMHDRIYRSAPSGLDEHVLERLARELGLDLARFSQAIRDGRHDAAIDRDMAAGDGAGIEGTPAFLVNDYYLMGLQPLEALSAVVEQAERDRARPAE